MDAREALERSMIATEPVVAAIDESEYSFPTPCTEWDVHALLNHLVGQLWYLEGTLAGTPPRYGAKPGGLPDRDLMGEGPIAAYKQVADAVREAARDDAALERAKMSVGAITGDLVVHGWDLAAATGRSLNVDDDLAEFLLGFMERGLTPENRAPAFGPVVTIPDDAAPAERLIAIAGRDPAWSSAR